MEIFASLLKELTTVLVAKKIKVVTAESCTGGLLAGLLTELPGSSAWFERGFVTYSNISKQELLGVEKELLDTFGAVSQEVVASMALGALKRSRATLAIAITGIAGPDGAVLGKPVGTVWFGFCHQSGLQSSFSCSFQGASRLAVRQYACEKALRGMLDFLQSVGN